jgi:tRNA(fMet)-specific endonuclease VapC
MFYFQLKKIVVPITNALQEWASQKSILKKKRELIDDLDLFIGTTAIVNNMVLVTDNEKHLNRLTNIKLENWVKS